MYPACIYSRLMLSKKGKRKVQGVPQSQTAALPRPLQTLHTNTRFCKQCRSWRDGLLWAVSSGTTLFAIMFWSLTEIPVWNNGYNQLQRWKFISDAQAWKGNILPVDVSWHSKICYFCYSVWSSWSKQAISGGNVSESRNKRYTGRRN